MCRFRGGKGLHDVKVSNSDIQDSQILPDFYHSSLIRHSVSARVHRCSMRYTTIPVNSCAYKKITDCNFAQLVLSLVMSSTGFSTLVWSFLLISNVHAQSRVSLTRNKIFQIILGIVKTALYMFPAVLIIILLRPQALVVVQAYMPATFIIQNNALKYCSTVGAGTGTVDLFSGTCTYRFIPSSNSTVLHWHLKISGIQNK